MTGAPPHLWAVPLPPPSDDPEWEAMAAHNRVWMLTEIPPGIDPASLGAVPYTKPVD